MKTARWLLYLSCGICWCSIGGARAQLIKSDSFPLETYSSPRTLQIARFNPSEGTLEKVTIDFSPTYSGTLLAQSAVSSPGNFNGWSFSFTPSTVLTGPGISLPTTFPTYSQGGVISQPRGIVSFSLGPDAIPATPLELTTDLNLFTGSGSVAFQVSAAFNPEFAWSQGGSSGMTHKLGATLQVTYDYTPVPEPSNSVVIAAFLLSGFASLRLCRFGGKQFSI